MVDAADMTEQPRTAAQLSREAERLNMRLVSVEAWNDMVGMRAQARPAVASEGLLRELVEAWDAMTGKVTFNGTAPDSVDLGLAFDAVMDRARTAFKEKP